MITTADKIEALRQSGKYSDMQLHILEKKLNREIVIRQKRIIIKGQAQEEQSIYDQVILYKERYTFDKEKMCSAYLDRMRDWEPEKYEEASKAIGHHNLYRVNGLILKDVDKFLTIYNGYPCRLLEAAENLGYNGYHYTMLVWEKIQE